MKRAFPILLDTLYALALALWFGLAAGLLAMVRPGPPDATLDLYVRHAGGLIEAAGVAMVGVQFLLRRRYAQNRQVAVADGVRQLLTFGALILAEGGRYSLLKPGAIVTAHAFNVLCQLADVQMLLLAVVTALTAWLLVPRTMVVTTVTPSEPPVQARPAPAMPPKPMKPTTQQKRK